ncbi:hypothetical protein [Clostridium botulinum]|uniref:Uncharacterized protein n=1 Tax=Clostridium botulinum TaxID=1491 RepID=A0A9Q1UZ56_CLOBO|nr:hypothetical protein [Clostridium botulinum]AEB77432.1 hypothetical protein CbC4_5011 [Clostridium botulinum BKT015925]KEH96027.1 hypothetical protein Y848_p0011 [Clostridium botulinum C/D str. Sp77]KEH96984.1 hypothetical protein Z953_13370 [Clostridium botulinum D str. 16868]KLU74603.1 hypothetical protein CBC3_12965 [Clostridium botulinum V891]KOA74094.1 hypothetical protein ADU78_11220 [Clostridium botulinum]
MKNNNDVHALNLTFKWFLGVLGIVGVFYFIVALFQEIMGDVPFQNNLVLILLFAKVIFFLLIPFVVSLGVKKFLRSIKKLTYEEQKLKRQHEKEEAKRYYDENVRLCYLDTKEMFRDAMKSRKLNRQQILRFKSKLNDCLSSHNKLRDYKNFYFKNDAYEIYTKLKNVHLVESDFERLQKYLSNVIR